LYEKSEFVLGPQIRGEDVHYDISDEIDRYLDITTIDDFIEVSLRRDNDAIKLPSQGAEPRLRRDERERSTAGIWSANRIRVFISHTSAHRKDVGDLANVLEGFGLSCFVAHDAIEPSREWQTAIQDALATMDAMIIYVTADFHGSLWTDQEVGWALARSTLLIPINAGATPYGFFGAFQALPLRDPDSLPEDVLRALAIAVYRRQRSGAERFDSAVAQAVAEAFSVSHSFDATRRRFPLLELVPISAWRTEDFALLRKATVENRQVAYANLIDGRTAAQAVEDLVAVGEAPN
jgi:hypothetical protein